MYLLEDFIDEMHIEQEVKGLVDYFSKTYPETKHVFKNAHNNYEKLIALKDKYPKSYNSQISNEIHEKLTSNYLNETQKDLIKFLDSLGHSFAKNQILKYYHQDNIETLGKFLSENRQFIPKAKQQLFDIERTKRRSSSSRQQSEEKQNSQQSSTSADDTKPRHSSSRQRLALNIPEEKDDKSAEKRSGSAQKKNEKQEVPLYFTLEKQQLDERFENLKSQFLLLDHETQNKIKKSFFLPDNADLLEFLTNENQNVDLKQFGLYTYNENLNKLQDYINKHSSSSAKIDTTLSSDQTTNEKSLRQELHTFYLELEKQFNELDSKSMQNITHMFKLSKTEHIYKFFKRYDEYDHLSKKQLHEYNEHLNILEAFIK